MKSYKYRVIFILVLTTALLSQYQNCGSSKNAGINADDSLGQPEDIIDGENRPINEISTGGIQFVQSKTIVKATDQTFSAYGTCEKDGVLGWQLLDSSGALLYKGKSTCDKSFFQVDFEGVEYLDCDANLILKATFGAQAKTETLIIKKCN